MAKKKILFIEDEPDIVLMMKVRLEANDYQMLSAADGEEGLKKAHDQKPDLILLDILIPKINGLVVCERLKTDPQTKDIPIIIVSGSGGKDLSERCKKAGANDLVVKPFDAGELLSKITANIK